VLPEHWTLFNQTMSAYDSLRVGFLAITLVLAAAWGLVPTIRHRHSQWIPQSRQIFQWLEEKFPMLGKRVLHV
jgi:hypothetical protein